MLGDLLDSPWKILIVAVVIMVLFGSKKLPDAARSLGRSMRILKAEVGTLHQDEPELQRADTDGAPAWVVPGVAGRHGTRRWGQDQSRRRSR